MNMEQWFSSNGYITRRELIEPRTLTIKSVQAFDSEEWPSAMNFEFSFAETDRKFHGTEHDYWSAVAATGADWSEMPGKTLKLYPIDYPKPHIEIF